METFFKENTEVQELVDLLIEKLFTVCLLGGSDSDSEFFRGRQAAEKITNILQNITNLPEDTLKEGIRQLVEQRLPDPRVIDNFPQFYNYMDEMLQSGISFLCHTEPVFNPPSSVHLTGIPSSKIVLTRGPETTKNSPPVYIPEVIITDNEENVFLNVFAPLSSSTSLLPDALPIPFESEARTSIPEALKSDSKLSEAPMESLACEQCLDTEGPLPLPLSETLAKTDVTLMNKVIRSSQVPVEGERLSMIFKQLYPKEKPRWNVMIGHYSIFAQVCNLLIYVPHDKATGAIATDTIKSDLQKEGWHIVICQQEDLVYPRRLERAIRQTLRETVHSNRPSSFL